MLTGFKKFILKGNVIDLAVAVIIGAAFSSVVDALVKSVMMPLISLLVGEPNFDDFLAFGDVRFGVLLTAVVNFLLVAAACGYLIFVGLGDWGGLDSAPLAVPGLPEYDGTGITDLVVGATVGIGVEP